MNFRSLRICTSVCTFKTNYNRKCDFMKFSDNLSTTLLRIIERDSLSYEKLAHLCDISARFMTKIIHRKSIPSLRTLQKMCDYLNCTPNDLLLGDYDSAASYRIAMPIVEFTNLNTFNEPVEFPLCPKCNAFIDRDYQAFCAECGQRLNWDNF